MAATNLLNLICCRNIFTRKIVHQGTKALGFGNLPQDPKNLNLQTRSLKTCHRTQQCITMIVPAPASHRRSREDNGGRRYLCLNLVKPQEGSLLMLVTRCSFTVSQCRHMAGHSHWANIKHNKGRMDALKSARYSKAVTALKMAVKEFGPDPKKNSKLLKIITESKKSGIPKELIERTLTSLSKTSDKVHIFEMKGPSSSNLLFQVRCTNVVLARNVINNTFTKTMSNVGIQPKGSILNCYDNKGIINTSMVEDKQDVDEYLEVAIDVGAEDVTEQKDDEGNSFLEFICDPADLQAVQSELQKKNFDVWYAEEHYFPLTTTVLTDEEKQNVLKAIRKLRDNDNFEIENVTTNVEEFDPNDQT